VQQQPALAGLRDSRGKRARQVQHRAIEHREASVDGFDCDGLTWLVFARPNSLKTAVASCSSASHVTRAGACGLVVERRDVGLRVMTKEAEDFCHRGTNPSQITLRVIFPKKRLTGVYDVSGCTARPG
jgi:hypothetical protein